MSSRNDFRACVLPVFFRSRRRVRTALTALLLTCLLSLPALAQALEKTALVDNICTLIETHAKQHGLPPDFFARLIWIESRFNPNAVSPKGAQGIAQFMPQTAALRGLRDSFDIKQAIPASAAYLAALKQKFGNLGLAAAAYNAGEARIGRWLDAGGFLPTETENYVLQILGEPADRFTDRRYAAKIQPLNSKKPFSKACRDLPVSGTATAVAVVKIKPKPWGIQVAGHFRRDVAMQQWERTRKQYAGVLSTYQPVVSQVRSPLGKNSIYAVRIGADSRNEADRICNRLRSAGGSCIVLRNR